jgi:Flp pilus assembly protein TadB
VSNGKRRLQWGLPEAPPPKHPIRDTLLVYAGLAGVVVVVAWVTGGSPARALVVAVVFFLLASLWNLWRFRDQLRAGAARRRAGGNGARGR